MSAPVTLMLTVGSSGELAVTVADAEGEFVPLVDTGRGAVVVVTEAGVVDDVGDVAMGVETDGCSDVGTVVPVVGWLLTDLFGLVVNGGMTMCSPFGPMMVVGVGRLELFFDGSLSFEEVEGFEPVESLPPLLVKFELEGAAE